MRHRRVALVWRHGDNSEHVEDNAIRYGILQARSSSVSVAAMSKLLYPASNDLSAHPDSASIKIARNLHCTVCENCSGLRPGAGIELVRDDDSAERENALINDLVGYGSDDDDSGNGGLGYIGACRCGHSVKDHGADENLLGEEEFARRSALAVRIDECLEVSQLAHRQCLRVLGHLDALLERV